MVTLNVVEAAPAGTVTLAGVFAAAMLDESATDRPPVGAAPVIVIVQELEAPPNRLAGEQMSEEGTGGGRTVSEATAILPL